MKSLPPDKQKEVEDFVDFLAKKYAIPKLTTQELVAKRRAVLLGPVARRIGS